MSSCGRFEAFAFDNPGALPYFYGREEPAEIGGSEIPRKGVVLSPGILLMIIAAVFSAETSMRLPEIGRLEPSDKAALADALRMKADLGEEIWPGFGMAEIPVVIYDDDFEYLFGESNPPGPWEIIADDDFQGKPYFGRRAASPQAFAVDWGRGWAGSLSTMSRMNRKIPMKLGPDWYSLGLIHEIFHAYQAESAPETFAAARGVYTRESRYPFESAEFAAAWDAEGAALSRALKAVGAAEVATAADEFLGMRDARRKTVGLPDDLIDFEKRLEWLEGLAKYVEIRANELAVARIDQEDYARYKSGLHFLVRADFARLGKALGRQKNDLRFYLSGMAIARILDRLDPDWKRMALAEKNDLENLLRAAIEKER